MLDMTKNDKNDPVIQVLERELSKPTVFRNEHVLDHSFLPSSLKFREKQLLLLTHYFRPLLSQETPLHPHIILHGPVGVGKTTTMRVFGSKATKIARNHVGRSLNYVHVNCRRYRGSDYQTLKAILSEIWSPVPPRGYSIGELVEILETQLKKRHLHLLVAIDDAEFLNGSDLINLLVQLKDNDKKSDTFGSNYGVSVILIVRDGDWIKNVDPTTRSVLRTNLIYFPPYTAGELEVLLKNRAEMALKPRTIDYSIIKIIAQHAAETGDCRRAIEILHRAGVLASQECQNSIPRITLEHVNRAIQHIKSHRRSYLPLELQNLPKQHKIILFCLFNALDDPKVNEITLKELKEKYELLIKSNSLIKPIKDTRFWEIIQELVRAGLITKEIRSSRGRVTYLKISDKLQSAMKKVSFERWMEGTSK